MKYRRLSTEELEDLEEDFIKFLAANTVTAEDWEGIKKEYPDRAEKLIEMFSDIVLEKVLSKVDLLETRTKDRIQYLVFQDGEVQMLGIMIEENSEIDFREENSKDRIHKSLESHGGELKLLKASRKIKGSENEDKFALLESHYRICKDKSLYNALIEIAAAQ